MKKINFVSLVMGTVGGILFALGMCMCLISEWGTFRQGVFAGIAGLVVLLAMRIVRRRMQGKPAVVLRAKAAGTAALGVAAALVLGTGMCMTMVWEGLLIPGIVVGIVGILLFLCLIPVRKGLR
ncbi:hypothetical protein [Qiania dongpingensis]|uniref:Uncharacterized protein n=1 Tax=Qiania dongpingensis TaxID=2763669 RepID=A0A7G9G315_9FIRM|nr:hypothetical protein [Qiania dongpingensis]QNM05197.1 hypothetical protein H9Q78_12225 [Qiania dongpingensis]